MTAVELIDTVEQAGGLLTVVGDGDRVRARLPESLMPLVTVIREMKPELIELLLQRPAMPAGVRLIRWNPKAAPVRLSECSTVTNVDLFIRSTLMQLEACLNGKPWMGGNWGLSRLLERLEAVGCLVALENPRRALQ
jgi:hypothetical protein